MLVSTFKIWPFQCRIAIGGVAGRAFKLEGIGVASVAKDRCEIAGQKPGTPFAGTALGHFEQSMP